MSAQWHRVVNFFLSPEAQEPIEVPHSPKHCQPEEAVDEAAVEVNDQMPADPQEPLEEMVAVDEAAVEVNDQMPADPQEPLEAQL